MRSVPFRASPIRSFHSSVVAHARVVVTGSLGGVPLTLESGRFAPLTASAVFATLGGTSVLASAVSSKTLSEENFLPLAVDFRERAFAFGQIPPSPSRSEPGGGTTRDILVGRAVDRALRPLFPEGYFYDTQVTVSLLSSQPGREPDAAVLALIAASAALHAGPIPFSEPAAAVRIGWVDGAPLLSPPSDLLPGMPGSQGRLDLLYAGASRSRALMLELGADELSDADIGAALRLADVSLGPLLDLQHELRDAVGTRAEKRIVKLIVPSPALKTAAHETIFREAVEAFSTARTTKAERSSTQGRLIGVARKRLLEAFPEENPRAVGIAADDAVRDAMRAVTEESASRTSEMIRNALMSTTNANTNMNMNTNTTTTLHAEAAMPASSGNSSDGILSSTGEGGGGGVAFFDAPIGSRVDGRDTQTTRLVIADVGLVPRVHGSALFSRGDTQVLAVTTLGPTDLELFEDNGVSHSLTPTAIVLPTSTSPLETTATAATSTNPLVPVAPTTPNSGPAGKRFFLHYDFPPYATNEVGKVGGVNRRMMGHGALAERAVAAVFPRGAAAANWPYVVRVVAETTASDGSSSMASVCAASLALADAGVPLRTHVAGVSIGLVLSQDQSRATLLTDILGLEDHAGDMDFKVAGSSTGITAAQLDVKPAGVPLAVLLAALPRAASARTSILSVMATALPSPRTELAVTAPRTIALEVPAELRTKVIGPGGANLRRIEALAGVRLVLDIDSAVLTIFGTADALVAAQALISASVSEALRAARSPLSIDLIQTRAWPRLIVGVPVRCRVAKINDFGAVLESNDDTKTVGSSTELGWLHISDLTRNRVGKVSDMLSEGDIVTAQVCDVDSRGRGRFSIRVLVRPGEDTEKFISRKNGIVKPFVGGGVGVASASGGGVQTVQQQPVQDTKVMEVVGITTSTTDTLVTPTTPPLNSAAVTTTAVVTEIPIPTTNVSVSGLQESLRDVMRGLARAITQLNDLRSSSSSMTTTSTVTPPVMITNSSVTSSSPRSVNSSLRVNSSPIPRYGNIQQKESWRNGSSGGSGGAGGASGNISYPERRMNGNNNNTLSNIGNSVRSEGGGRRDGLVRGHNDVKRNNNNNGVSREGGGGVIFMGKREGFRGAIHGIIRSVPTIKLPTTTTTSQSVVSTGVVSDTALITESTIVTLTPPTTGRDSESLSTKISEPVVNIQHSEVVVDKTTIRKKKSKTVKEVATLETATAVADADASGVVAKKSVQRKKVKSEVAEVVEGADDVEEVKKIKIVRVRKTKKAEALVAVDVV